MKMWETEGHNADEEISFHFSAFRFNLQGRINIADELFLVF